MKRRVIMNINKTNAKGKIERQCSRVSKLNKLESATVKNDKAYNPSIRCHEEVMSRLSNCPSNDPDHLSDHTEPCSKKSHFLTKNIGRKNTLKEPNESENKAASVSSLAKLNCPKTVRSKSVPTIHKPKIDDNVDYIPVKLLSKEQTNLCSHRNHKHHSEKTVDSRKRSMVHRATWDTLLKGEGHSEISSNNMKKVSDYANHEQEPTSDESSTDRYTKKKTTLNNCKNKYTGKGDADNHGTNLHSGRSDTVYSNEVNGVDPVKTLDFLIKYLRGKLNKQQDENLQNIIFDMENALLKISLENERETNTKTNQPENICESPATEPTPRYSPKATSNGMNNKDVNEPLNIQQLQSKLEESCIFLQSLCMKQRENCHSHTKEKELLTIQLAESRRLLALTKSKEKDYEVTICNLRLQVKEVETRSEQQSQYIKELNSIITKLRSENQILHSYEDTIKKLNNRIKELTHEKDVLNSNLKDLEIEKLKFLLDRKENLNPTQVNKLKARSNDNGQPELHLNDLEDKDTSTLSFTSLANWSQDKNGIACSSQTSSSPRRSPSPYNSWQHISIINPRPSDVAEINKEIPNFFQNLRKKTNFLPLDLELPSSDNSMWDSKDELNS